LDHSSRKPTSQLLHEPGRRHTSRKARWSNTS
jgi:hypothetical protein